jgi:predicted site-specific integrase-resolvase
MGISAKEAAERVGISKDGILKAIRTGKISAQKDINGTWQIEPVELFRVYPAVSTSDHAPIDATLQSSTEASTDSLQSEIKVLREMLQRQDEVIADLRGRLDVATEGWHKTTLILSDKQQPRSWWQRVFGGTA